MQFKQFPPTAKRLRDARRRGDVAHSADISSTVHFVAVVCVVWLMAGSAIEALHGLWLHVTSGEAMAQPDVQLVQAIQHALWLLAGTVIAMGAVSALSAAAGSFFQVGGLAAWSRLHPKASHLNPGQGIKRLFSMRNVVNLSKLTLKVALLAALLLAVVRGQLDTAARVGYLRPDGQMATIGHAIVVLLGWAAVIYAVVSALDHMHQRYEFMKRNRMSVEDIRRELMETEGSVLNQQRRRAEHHESVFSGVDDRVRRCTLVVRSLGVAVALQYLKDDPEPPRIVALGQGAAADQIHAVARACQRFVEFNPALAQRLFEEGVLDLPAPSALAPQLQRLLQRALGRDDAARQTSSAHPVFAEQRDQAGDDVRIKSDNS